MILNYKILVNELLQINPSICLLKKKFDASYFRGRNCFGEDGVQSSLVFKPMHIFSKHGSTGSISLWESKGLIKPTDNSLATAVKFTGKRMYVKLSGSCLKQNKITFNHGKTVNIYIAYDLKSNLNNFDPTLKKCLFGTIKLTKIIILINMNTQAVELDLF